MDEQPIDQKSVESGGSIFSRLIWRQLEEDGSSNRDKISVSLPERCLKTRVDASFEGIMSTSGINGDGLANHGEYVSDHSSLLSLQPWVFRRENYQNDEEKMKLKCEFSGRSGCESCDLSPRSVRLGYGPGRSRSSTRSRRTRRYSVRPLTSTGNCLIPQLYNEHFEIEEYVFNSDPSQAAPTMRPLIVTDGNRVISRSGYDPLGNPFGNSLHKEVNGASSEVMDTVIAVPSLPELRKPKRKSREAHVERPDTSTSQRSCKLSQSQGSSDRMLLLCLGISIGVISSFLSSKREIEKLNNLLKDTDNLVQDLQEELEMKESLTVKELTNEAYESQERHRSYANIKFRNLVSTSYVPAEEGDQLHLPKAVENSELLSKIEAELEVELERLELNMAATSLEERVSVLGELDSDLIADAVYGELRADMLDSGAQECETDPYGESSSTSTTHTDNPNHAISPRELSLRLHEVLQYRLEERIEELERELQQSQNKLRLMEVEQALSQGSFSNSDIGPSNHDSTTVSELDSALAQPLCLNLSGDALIAYDEAYEEFMRMTDTGEMDKNLYGDGLRRSDLDLIWGMQVGSGDKSSTDVECFEREPTWEQVSRSEGYDDDAEESHEYEIDDEDGKMIQQIVERTRQGSPVVMHAQRMLFPPDE